MNIVNRITAILCACMLGGCASIASVSPGTDLAELRARFGPPTVESIDPDGASRLVYGTGPFGQFAYAVTVRGGKVAGIRQVLTNTEFAQVRIGHDDRAAIRARFGPPAEISRLTLTPREVWSYRMKLDDVFPALMHVQFSADGIVREMIAGPDPLYDPQPHGYH